MEGEGEKSSGKVYIRRGHEKRRKGGRERRMNE